jgi:uncharacterized protein YndB with AHSA1/START domain
VIELPWHHDRLLLAGDFPGFTPHDLFDYWTKPELLAKFWPPVAMTDLRAGGYYRFEWPDSGWYLHGHYLRLERGVRLDFDWTWNHELGRYTPLKVEMYFKAIEGGARMTIEHFGFAPEELQAMPSTAQGWIHFGDRLRALRAEV